MYRQNTIAKHVMDKGIGGCSYHLPMVDGIHPQPRSEHHDFVQHGRCPNHRQQQWIHHPSVRSLTCQLIKCS